MSAAQSCVGFGLFSVVFDYLGGGAAQALSVSQVRWIVKELSSVVDGGDHNVYCWHLQHLTSGAGSVAASTASAGVWDATAGLQPVYSAGGGLADAGSSGDAALAGTMLRARRLRTATAALGAEAVSESSALEQLTLSSCVLSSRESLATRHKFRSDGHSVCVRWSARQSLKCAKKSLYALIPACHRSWPITRPA